MFSVLYRIFSEIFYFFGGDFTSFVSGMLIISLSLSLSLSLSVCLSLSLSLSLLGIEPGTYAW
jgi:hypothetical protein